MKRSKITITDNEKVIVPSEIRMNISEIADLFGIFDQTAKGISGQLRNIVQRNEV